MARTKNPNKVNKTLLKRFKRSNPKGNKIPKYQYKASGQHHGNAATSSTAQNRKSGDQVVDKTLVKKYNLK